MEASYKKVVDKMRGQEYSIPKQINNQSMQSIPQQATFNVETLIVVNDSDTGRTCIRGSTTYPLGEFQLDLKEEWLDDVCKFDEQPSNTFEEFEECFIGQSEEIKVRIIDDILGHPRFDHDDGLQEIFNYQLSICKDEIDSICAYLKISEKDFYGVLIQPDGFIIDRVFAPMDVVECFRSHKSGKIDEEEFAVAISESYIEFEVQCHMVFDLILDSQKLINSLIVDQFCDQLDNEEGDDWETILDGLVNKLVDRLAYLKNCAY